jgi:hypothetical protein
MLDEKNQSPDQDALAGFERGPEQRRHVSGERFIGRKISVLVRKVDDERDQIALVETLQSLLGHPTENMTFENGRVLMR